MHYFSDHPGSDPRNVVFRALRLNLVLWFILGALLVGTSLLLAGQGVRLFHDTPVE